MRFTPAKLARVHRQNEVLAEEQRLLRAFRTCPPRARVAAVAFVERCAVPAEVGRRRPRGIDF